MRDWIVAAQLHGVEIFDTRDRLKALLITYAVDRATGDPERRLGAVTWNQHMSVLGMFYRWATAEGYATAVPFTYQQAVVLYAETVREVLVNQARRRVPHAHVTIKYLEDDFAAMFINGLAGLRPDGSEDEGPGRFRGRHLARKGAVGELVVSSGTRLQEFSYLLACEVPPLPAAPRLMPIAFPLPEGITKGSKFRVTWTSYGALARVHSYDLRPWGGATASAIAEKPSGRTENKPQPVDDAVMQPMLAAALFLVSSMGPHAVELARQIRTRTASGPPWTGSYAAISHPAGNATSRPSPANPESTAPPSTATGPTPTCAKSSKPASPPCAKPGTLPTPGTLRSSG
ncbi:hypothetical protein ABT009_43950 [Streptomyces sp. NPDC002896]|uniref:hypothetical protein n=1 Tax=Streptomyces sp. NPDC002896 TaxID=3154438 RepID=UPI00332C7251